MHASLIHQLWNIIVWYIKQLSVFGGQSNVDHKSQSNTQNNIANDQTKLMVINEMYG